VVNADQTVILIWDAATKTQHFIRQASFKSEADDFGFLVPTPAQPVLEESGNDAFGTLQKLTEPEKKKSPPSGGMGCGCGAARNLSPGDTQSEVRVLEEKMVAGFNAVVLETKSADDLVAWLKDHGYAYSPELQAWAKPYVESGWKITALKVAKNQEAKDKTNVAASALRMTFQTDRPLFPYREPDSNQSAEVLGAKNRLLRIYLIADSRYKGELTKEDPWTGNVAWAGPVKDEDRKQLLEQLKLPLTTGPKEWWLTEFEDIWPYRVAPADVFFSRDADQKRVRRPAIYVSTSPHWPTDGAAYALAGVLVLTPLWNRLRRRHKV